MPVPNLSAWRREATGDLTSAIDFAGGTRNPDGFGSLLTAAAQVASDGERVVVQCANMGTATLQSTGYPVPTTQSLPHQEPGTARRPSGPICAS